jgi:hypothetical protein
LPIAITFAHTATKHFSSQNNSRSTDHIMPSLTWYSIFALAGCALAHLQLAYPAPFNASNNPHRTTHEDPYLQYPYNCCGPAARWEYPCRDYHNHLGTPDGLPTATWEIGSQQSWSMAGIGNHYGGSCQIGFSIDHGETFRVSTSYEGNCPRRNTGNGPEGQEFPFTVPHDMTPGIHLFAWTWYNREQEFNMNCAAVNITVPTTTSTSPYQQPSTTIATSDGGASATPTEPASTYKTANGLLYTCEDPTNISTCDCACPGTLAVNNKRNNQDQHPITFSARPMMLVADDGKGCLTPKADAELKFPQPGYEVVTGDGEYPLRLPEGHCMGVE